MNGLTYFACNSSLFVTLSACTNVGHVRRIFKLQNLVIVRNELGTDGHMTESIEFLPKNKLMEKLEDVDNLINAMGALFYVSRRMSN